MSVKYGKHGSSRTEYVLVGRPSTPRDVKGPAGDCTASHLGVREEVAGGPSVQLRGCAIDVLQPSLLRTAFATCFRYPVRMPLRGFGTNGFQGEKADISVR